MDISNIDSKKTPLQNVKQRFFALRNGLLADQLRKGGSPYPIIFGLNLPQLREIASAFGINPELAELLWSNDTTRESRLLAPMLADRKFFSEIDAGRWISSLKGSTEEADILCHSLLRHLPFSNSLRAKLSQSDKPIYRYLGLRLLFTEIANDPENAKSIAEREFEKNEPLTRAIAHQIIDEANFLKEA